MTRVQAALSYATILAVCLAGAFHLSWWSVGAAAAALVLISLALHRPYYSRYGSQGDLGAQSMLLLGSTLNATTAAAVAFALGRAIVWLWGI